MPRGQRSAVGEVRALISAGERREDRRRVCVRRAGGLLLPTVNAI